MLIAGLNDQGLCYNFCYNFDYCQCTFCEYILDVKKIFLPNYRAGQYNDAIKKRAIVVLWIPNRDSTWKECLYGLLFLSNPTNDPWDDLTSH